MLHSDSDEFVQGALMFCFVMFVLELASLSYAQKGYWCGFFFALDLLATFSMVFDIELLGGSR
jgi:hypothetical protein